MPLNIRYQKDSMTGDFDLSHPSLHSVWEIFDPLKGMLENNKRCFHTYTGLLMVPLLFVAHPS